MGEFNHAQREAGKKERSNGSSHNWLKAYRPKVAICPHKEASVPKVEIHSKQTTINCLMQSAEAIPESIKELEDSIKSIRKDQHQKEAQESHT